jgi:hypothetical protein
VDPDPVVHHLMRIQCGSGFGSGSETLQVGFVILKIYRYEIVATVCRIRKIPMT